MGTVFEQVIPPKRGLAVTVRRGQRLRVTDLEGKQVVDMAVFNAANPREKLSTSYSRTRYPMKVEADYVYVMDFDGDRIRHLTKIWNDGISLEQLGWM